MRAASSFGILVLCLIIVAGSGCAPSGNTVGKLRILKPYRAEVSPRGVSVSIKARGGPGLDIKGELIAVREDGFLVLHESKPAAIDSILQTRGGPGSVLMLMPYDQMKRISFKPRIGVSLSVNGSKARNVPPLKDDPARQGAVALYSRYPYGTDAQLIAELLTSLGQSGIVVVGS